RIDTVQRVARGAVQPAAPERWPGPLVCPDGADVAFAEVVHGLGHLGVPLVSAEADGPVRHFAGPVVGRPVLPFGVVEVIGLGSRARKDERLGVRAHPPRGHVFGLLRRAARPFGGDFTALAEVAPTLPDDGRGGGVPGPLPDRRAVVLAETEQSAV